MATLFGVYKLLLRIGDGSITNPIPQYDPNKSVKHAIPKHTLEDQEVVRQCVCVKLMEIEEKGKGARKRK